MANFEYYKLANGVKVLLVPMAGVRSCAVGVFVKVGSRYEAIGDQGISHFLEHMTFKGTKNYPTVAQTSSLEGLGAMQNAWTDVDATSYYCKIPSDYFAKGLNLVADLALNPLIPETDLQIEKGVIIEEIRRRQDQPDELIWEEFGQLLFAGHPLGVNVSGREEVIKNSTRQQLLDYHARHYVSQNLFVVAAGDIPEGTKEQISKLFTGLPDKSGVEFSKFVPPAKTKKRIVNRPKDNQVYLVLGGYGANSFDRERYIQNILMTLLGSGMSSRLFMELREKRGLCYSVYSAQDIHPDTGLWAVFAGVATDKYKKALQGITDQLKNLQDHLISAEELNSTQQFLRGSMIFAQENPLRQMEFYARQALDRDNLINDYAQTEQELMEVTAEDVQKCAQKLFKSDNQYLTILGPVLK